MWFDCRVKEVGGKTGRNILSWYFFIHTREDEKNIDMQDAVKNRIQINSILSAFLKNDKNLINNVLNYIDYDPNKSQSMLEKLRKIYDKYDKKDVAPILRHVLDEDFGLK